MYMDILKDAMQANDARERAIKEFEKLLDTVAKA